MYLCCAQTGYQSCTAGCEGGTEPPPAPQPRSAQGQKRWQGVRLGGVRAGDASFHLWPGQAGRTAKVTREQHIPPLFPASGGPRNLGKSPLSGALPWPAPFSTSTLWGQQLPSGVPLKGGEGGASLRDGWLCGGQGDLLSPQTRLHCSKVS